MRCTFSEGGECLRKCCLVHFDLFIISFQNKGAVGVMGLGNQGDHLSFSPRVWEGERPARVPQDKGGEKPHAPGQLVPPCCLLSCADPVWYPGASSCDRWLSRPSLLGETVCRDWVALPRPQRSWPFEPT